MRLEDKVAIVTGAGTGIGKAISAAFGSHGAGVVVAGPSHTPIEDVASEIRALGGNAIPIGCDVGRPEDAKRVVAETAAYFGGLDVLVNNAAISVDKDLEDLTLSDWNAVLSSNLTGQFLMAQAAIPQMRRRGSGSIINIGSVHDGISAPHSTAYASSKGGVAQLTRSLAIELGRFNILVNLISPGFVGDTYLSMKDGVDETTTGSFRSSYLNSGRIPLRRAGTTSDIAAVALFLAARECTYMTGANLAVDGGLTLTL